MTPPPATGTTPAQPTSGPAPISTPGPIIQPGNKLTSPLVIVIVLALLGIGGWFGWSFVRDIGKKGAVETECHSFDLARKLEVKYSGFFCNVTAGDHRTFAAVRTLPSEVTESNLKEYAKLDFADSRPGSDISSELATSFAGRPAYRINVSSGEHRQAYIYMYDPKASITLNKKKYHAFMVNFGANDDKALQDFISTAEKRWTVAGEDGR